MSGLLSLVKNENMKIYRRPRTWIMAAVMIVLVIVVAVIMQQIAPEVGDQWRGKVQEDIQQNEQQLKDMANAPEAFTAQTKVRIQEDNVRLQYALDHDISPYDTNNWDFVNGASVNVISLISLFAVVIAGSLVAGEFSWGSIKMLLIRPHPRWSVLLSKYLSALLYIVGMLVLLFVSSWLIGGLVFGFGGLNYADIVVDNGKVVKETAIVKGLQFYGFQGITTVILMTIAFMISTIFRSNALAIGISIFILYISNVLSLVLSQFDWAKYLIFSNLNLTYYLDHSEGMIEGVTFSFSLFIDLAYWLVFLIITWWIFQRRDIAN
ncbi:MAG TPA: ABC transporter permease [Bacillales bacterium]|nr:ABC transporter permease [Bacillales bacterium]